MPKISARNQLLGTIKKITTGAVNSEIILELPGGVEITSIITIESVKKLNLKEGMKAYGIIKASNIMIGID